MSAEELAQNGRVKMLRRWSTWCGVGVYALAALWGVIQVAFVNNSAWFFLTALMLAFFATQWAVYDAKSKGRPILPILQMLFFMVWPLGATIYLVNRNGWRGMVLALLHGLGLMLATGATFYMAFYSFHYLGMLDEQFYQ